MTTTYKDFIDFIESSELMSKVTPKKKSGILEKYRDLPSEQLDEAINEIKQHEEAWKETQKVNQEKITKAERKMKEAMQTAPKRQMDKIHNEEKDSKKKEEDILSSLENDLNNLN